jgi:hypothetical protein
MLEGLHWRPNFFQITYKNSLRTSQIKHFFSIIKTIQLFLFRKTIAAFFWELTVTHRQLDARSGLYDGWPTTSPAICSAVTGHKSGWQYGAHLFGPLKKPLAGKRFATDTDVNQAVTSRLDAWHRFLTRRYTSLSATVGQRLRCRCDYAEVWCVPSATTCSAYIKVRTKFLAVECLLPHFLRPDGLHAFLMNQDAWDCVLLDNFWWKSGISDFKKLCEAFCGR